MHGNQDRSRQASIVAALLLFFVAGAAQAAAQSSDTFVLKKTAMTGGGGAGSSPTLSVASGVGQAAPQGKASSDSYGVDPGFFKPNKPPLAAAGADIVVECSSPLRTVVTLDGSASTDPDQDRLHFSWTGAFGNATGATPPVGLPLGSSNITLVVNDDQVNSAPDSVQVQIIVRPQGLEPPLAALVPDGASAPLPTRASQLGKTLPLKLRLFCGSTAVTDQSGVPGPQIVGLRRTGAPVNLETMDLGAGNANDKGSAFRFSTDGSWIYNLSTKMLTAGDYVITIRMPDGRSFNTAFVLR